ncbi:beta-ketoacyl synthase domain-containing protein [Colletotrichum incanum]|uniref:Beta-ketoacyl synthase domain-containing protein n=1 Tax=Colletotrichum incanum TaxID=1573173 RepID=A0A161Y401_COLIC|nr:beta-ketoacyl synthase domain-containing protein [Colletotrichum incanum]
MQSILDFYHETKDLPKTKLRVSGPVNRISNITQIEGNYVARGMTAVLQILEMPRRENIHLTIWLYSLSYVTASRFSRILQNHFSLDDYSNTSNPLFTTNAKYA